MYDCSAHPDRGKTSRSEGGEERRLWREGGRERGMEGGRELLAK